MAHLEHIGIAVKDAFEVREFFEALLGLPCYKSEHVEREGVQTHFLWAGSTKLELLEATHEGSSVARHIQKRGTGIHHLAFEVANIRRLMQHLRQKGFTPLTNEPLQGADGKEIFFLHPRDTYGVLVEFCETQPIVSERVTCNGTAFRIRRCGIPTDPAIVILGELPDTLLRCLERQFFVIGLYPPTHLSTEMLCTLMDRLDVYSAHLVGYAAYGSLVLRFLQHHGTRANRIVLFSTRYSDITNRELSSIEHPVLVCGKDQDPLLPLDYTLSLHRILPNSTLAVLPGKEHTLQADDVAVYARLLVQHFLRA